jgi:hypothetical protein
VTVPKPPAALGLIFCERLEVVTSPARVSLVGLLNELRIKTFPAVLRFTAYAGLYGGTGEGTIELSMMNAETEKVAYRYSRWWANPGRGRFRHLEIPVRAWHLATPGRFVARIRFEGKELASRILSVRKEMP